MTNNERSVGAVNIAAEIVNRLRGNVVPWQKGDLELAVDICKAIEAAYDKGKLDGGVEAAGKCSEHTQKSYEAGLEDAARMAHDHEHDWHNENVCFCGFVIAERIRALKGKV